MASGDIVVWVGVSLRQAVYLRHFSNVDITINWSLLFIDGHFISIDAND